MIKDMIKRHKIITVVIAFGMLYSSGVAYAYEAIKPKEVYVTQVAPSVQKVTETPETIPAEPIVVAEPAVVEQPVQIIEPVAPTPVEITANDKFAIVSGQLRNYNFWEKMNYGETAWTIIKHSDAQNIYATEQELRSYADICGAKITAMIPISELQDVIRLRYNMTQSACWLN